jgi:hypothetical protein
LQLRGFPIYNEVRAKFFAIRRELVVRVVELLRRHRMSCSRSRDCTHVETTRDTAVASKGIDQRPSRGGALAGVRSDLSW